MDTTKELFYGNIHPFERDVPKDGEGDKLNQLIIRHTATLKATLNEQEMQIVEKLKDALTERQADGGIILRQRITIARQRVVRCRAVCYGEENLTKS